MGDAHLGLTCISRWRHARLLGLGDRKSPSAYSPCLVNYHGGIDFPTELAPFVVTTTAEIPADITIKSRLNLSPPFTEIGPEFSSNIGHVLPPSLEEADAGETGGSGHLLPISWQRICHDSELLSTDLMPQIIVLTDALQIANQQGMLAEALHTLKLRFPGALVWTPGLAGPDNAALLAWMGVDLFDLSRTEQALCEGYLLSAEGPRIPDSELGEVPDSETMQSIWRRELAGIRQAIRTGSLRELVEKRSANSPRLVEHLRYHDRITAASEHTFLESFVAPDVKMRCNTFVSRNDPAVVDWIQYIEQEYRCPKEQNDVLILLPCSARKPYRTSRSHKRFLDNIRNSSPHQVMVTAPLGLVPRDLERIWPACHYDIPVTGEWDGDELYKIRTLVKTFVEAQGYRAVINHSGIDFFDLEVPIIETRQGESAGARSALERLGKAVDELCERFGLRSIKHNKLLMAEYRSVARRHMTNDDWMNDLTIVGRPPRHKLMLGNEQLAQWNPERGGLSLSKSSLPIIYRHDSLPVVEIVHEGSWSGDIFTHMVRDYDPSIRSGADFLVVRDGELIGSARAIVPGGAWPDSPGKLAKSHHRLPSAK